MGRTDMPDVTAFYCDPDCCGFITGHDSGLLLICNRPLPCVLHDRRMSSIVDNEWELDQ